MNPGHPSAGGGRPVVTVTAAGAIDATYRVAALRRGSFTRSWAYERELSGKGVNVSAALSLAGRATRAVVVIGQDDLDFAARSDRFGMLRAVSVPGATRVNTSIIEDTGATTKVNSPPRPLDPRTWREVVDAALEEIDRIDAGWLVVSGSIPPLRGTQAPADISVLCAEARERGVLIALDSSGAALARAAADPLGLALIKPNVDELAELTRRSLRTFGEVAAAARQLVERGLVAVYASLGADGVLVVTAEGTVHAHAEPVCLANTAGAGDASLAGFLIGLGGGALDDADARAAAASAAASWGAHAVAQSSTIVPQLKGMPRATVTHDPDPGIVLSEPAILD